MRLYGGLECKNLSVPIGLFEAQPSQSTNVISEVLSGGSSHL